MCDFIDISANDYTILIENIPLEIDAINDDYTDDIKHFFENLLREDGIDDNVIEINLCYNLSEVQSLYKIKNDKIKEKKEIMFYLKKHKKFKKKTIKEIDTELYLLEIKILHLLA